MQASGQGRVERVIGEGLDNAKHATRAIFYARYIDWLITTPLLLVDVLLMARLPITAAVWAIFADIAMIVTGLIGGLVADQFR